MTRRLLIRPGAIGDFIVSLPALEALRADYTEVWCAAQNVPLARFAHRAQSIVSAGFDRLGLLNDEDVLERLAQFDDVISWSAASKPLPIRFVRALPDQSTHAVEFYLNQARELGGTVTSHYPRIPVPERPREFAVIHPFASSPSKRAPMEFFHRIARQLSEKMPVEWIAGPHDELNEELPGARRFPDLYQLACWLRGAKVFVGNDSGIAHLAAAVSTPVLEAFRSSDPKVWAARGPTVDYCQI